MAMDMGTLNRWQRAAQRALAADLTGDLVQRGSSILVASQTTDGKRYAVRLVGNRVGQCNCEAGLLGKPCAHRAAVAIRLYEKLGFVREGIQREALHRDGKRFDILMYAILRHEWEGRSNEG